MEVMVECDADSLVATSEVKNFKIIRTIQARLNHM